MGSFTNTSDLKCLLEKRDVVVIPTLEKLCFDQVLELRVGQDTPLVQKEIKRRNEEAQVLEQYIPNQETSSYCVPKRPFADSVRARLASYPRKLPQVETQLHYPEDPLPIVEWKCELEMVPIHELPMFVLRNLLGLRYRSTNDTTMLPPSYQECCISFNKLYQPGNRHNKLTVGARALTKHCVRCHEWWGECNGSDARKNALARVKLFQIIDHAVWMNTITIPRHGVVFEVREPSGYGARWSVDGKTFRGFVEPVMEDGHAKRWRH